LKRTIKYWVRPDIENRIKAGSIAARFSARLTEIRPTSVIVHAIGATEAADDEAARQRELATDADASRAPATTIVPPAGSAEIVAEIAADAVYLLTGYRADSDLLRDSGIALNDRQAPTHDRLTFETNVPGLFIAGGAIAGVDTGTVFIENGRFHGEKIVDTIARRLGR
jgi:thioredoxin reductase (NADPH)